MKYVLNLANKQVFYDENHIYIDGNVWANYTDNEVIWTTTSSKLAEINCYSDHSWALVEALERCIFEAHDRDKSLRNQSDRNKLVGKYTGPHVGALASFIAYEYYLTLPATEKIAKSTQTVKKDKEAVAPKTVKQDVQNEPEPIYISQKQSPPVKPEHKPETKYIPPKQELPKKEFIHEEPPVYKPPEEKHDEKYEYKPKVDKPSIQISSGSSEESSGCFGPLFWIPVGLILLGIAINMIPKSWRDLSVFIPEGDVGMTISFFAAVIGGILAVILALFTACRLKSCLYGFLAPCIIGIVINIFVLFKDILAGDYEFTGFILFDLPLAIFAPILGSFQFAFPIGIAVIIVCGIICLIKKD